MKNQILKKVSEVLDPKSLGKVFHRVITEQAGRKKKGVAKRSKGDEFKRINDKLVRAERAYAQDMLKVGHSYIDCEEFGRGIRCYQQVFYISYQKDLFEQAFYELGRVYVTIQDCEEAKVQFRHLMRIGSFSYANKLLKEIKREFGEDITGY